MKARPPNILGVAARPNSGRQESWEGIATEAGLTPESTLDTFWAYDYPDEEALARGMLAAGGLAVVAEGTGGDVVRTAIVESLAPYRTPSGGYRLKNERHYLIATVCINPRDLVERTRGADATATRMAS
jgi:hypothetical protein